MGVKYVFITGGVISSLGKGVATSSIGMLLKSRGYKVSIVKIDPYINVDPGTLSPYQHGEVFVTADGYECDLDIGNYERYIGTELSCDNNITAGRVYQTVINKERRGEYNGNTVQVIPHITNEIIDSITRISEKSKIDIVIVEVGGTVGDIESLPFVEAIRQMKLRKPDDIIFVHLTLVPYIETAGEVKTKPTQQSIRRLNELGIQPGIIICRTDRKLEQKIKEKIALFCNVETKSIIEAEDVKYVFEIPIKYKKQKVDQLILKKLGLPLKTSDTSEWEIFIKNIYKADKEVNIGLIGKYTELHDAYKSVTEALFHAGIANNCRVNVKWVHSESFLENDDKNINELDGLLIPGGFGERGIQGKIEAVKNARLNKRPFFGLCLGMQCAVIEFARNVAGLKNANSTEFDPKTNYSVIDIISEKKDLKDLGGTLRLGNYLCNLKKSSNASNIYGTTAIIERHRHRYEFNNKYKKLLADKGLIISGIYKEKNLVEIVELKDHPWFLAVQFHPEFNSSPLKPHPLFCSFIKASIDYRSSK